MNGRETLLFLHPTPDRYGPDVALVALVRGLDQRRWRPLVAMPRPGPLVPLLEAAGAEVVYGPLGVLDRRTLRSPLRFVRFLFSALVAIQFVRRLVRRHRPGLVHTNTAIVIGGALGARLSGARHVWHLHDIITEPRWAASHFARLAARLADVVVSNSQATRRSFDVHSAELTAKHRVVLNGVDRARLAPERYDRASARAALKVADDVPLVVLIGRVNTWKGHELLVIAAEKLRQRHPDAQFLLVGDAPEGQGRLVANLRRLIQDRGLTGCVRHLPHIDDIACVLIAADVVAVPSTRPEPFGLVAAEAMACGRPVVAASHGGLLEVVERGVTGLLFEPGDADKLAFALQVLIEDKGRAREMGRRGELRQRAAFSQERMVREMERIWSQLVQRPFTLPSHEAHIVHFALGTSSPEHENGIDQVAHQLAAAQHARGLDVSVIVITPSPEAPPATCAYPLQLFKAARGRFGLAPELLRALDELPPTTIAHLHGGYVPTMRALSKALNQRRIPYVLTPYGAYRALAREHSPWKRRLYSTLFERALARGARTVQAFSETEAAEMADLVSSTSVVIISEGQDTLERPAPESTPGLRRPLFTYCGQLATYTKGLDTLLDAFALHAAAGGDGTLWFIGDGVDRATLEARATELGVGRRIVFRGALFGAARLAALAASDVFVHPSRHEGMPTAVLEAAALGLPVVVAEGTNLEDAVRDAGAGFVLRRHDAEQLTATLAACERELVAGTLLERGRAAQVMAAQRFGWDVIEPRLRGGLYALEDAAFDIHSGPVQDVGASLAEAASPTAIGPDRDDCTTVELTPEGQQRRHCA